MADRNTKITTSQIADGTLLPTDLDATNVPVDTYIPKYNSATGDFTWVAQGLTSNDIDDFTIKYVNNKLKIADRIEQNIMLLAFYRAVDNSKSIYNLLDGFIDEYEDETGVDTGASTNEDYDSTNDLYKPLSTTADIDENTVLMLHLNNNVTDDGNGSVTGGHTVTNNNVTFNSETKKWGSHSGVFNGSTAYLSVPDSVDWDIVGSNADNWTIDFWVKHTDHVANEYYIMHGADGNDLWVLYHDDGQGIIFTYWVSGGAHGTGAGGEITDTNWHHIALCKVGSKYAVYKDGTQVNYLDDNTTLNATATLLIGKSIWGDYFDGYMDEIRIQHSNIFEASPLDTGATGYPDTITVPTAEYSETGATNNMTLISNSQTAETAPADARLVIFEEDVDSITLNTDLKGYVSRDEGTTWSQVTLSDEGNYEGSKRVLAGVIDISGQPSGTNIEYKIETLNAKDLKIHGIGVNWD